MTTTYKYDGFGHQIERVHPDAGTTKWIYDNAGNLIATQTQRQINDNTQTRYVYDYNRLIRTEYPLHPQLNVSYEYYSSTGGAGSTGGADGSSAQLRSDNSGRLAQRTDLTGSIAYQYDEFGNIKQEDRQIILPNEEKTYNFETRYNYDMLGRMTEIMYPDSEEVDYTYQLGQLTTIQGDNQSLAQEMKYDEYDHLTQMKHGNGYTTSYNYDTNRQWLKNSRTSNIYTSIGKRSILRDASYSYDRVGNIVAIQEYSEAYQPDGKTAITIPQIERDFSYDANNRLIHSSSTQQLVYGGGLMLPVYDYNITYSPSGMIASKTTTLNGVKTDLRYGYNVSLLRGQGGGTGFEGVSPSTDVVRNHQICTITSGEDTTELTWDADGQLTQMQRCRGVGVSPASNNDGEATVLSTRSHLWNESGQLALFISDDQAGYYGYDGNGERVYKLTGYVHKESYNAGEETTKVMLNDAVLYVNPYFIVTPKGYTKHYYNGSQRLASIVGDVNALSGSIVTTGGADGSSAQTMPPPSQRKSEEYMRTFANGDTLMKVQVHAEENMLYPVLSKEVKSQEDYNVKDNTYYYHGDHLGSCSWITDGNGELVEHRQYMPYGEEWYHYRSNVSTYVERYLFTGKERDEESGYDYFGARYYDAMLLTSWMSVDMMADFDAERTPYGYCRQNPLIHQDPDGNMPHVVVGAAIGAAVGAGFALYEGKSWSEVGAAAAGGAVMGAITAATGGAALAASSTLGTLGIAAGGGAVGGAAGSLTEQGINVATGNQANINIGDVVASAVIGGAFEGVGGVVNKIVGKSTEAAIGQIKSEYKSNYKSLYQQAKQDIKADYKKQGLLFNKSDIVKAARSKVSGFRDIDIQGVINKDKFIQQGVTPTVTNTAENVTNNEIK